MKSSEEQTKVSFEEPSDSSKIRYENARRSTCSQVVVMMVLVGLLLDIGMQASMPTIVIGALHRNPSERLSMNDEEASWFGSILSFSHPIGALISGFLQERFGRRGSMILVNIPTLAAWTTLHLADSIYQLYIVAATMGLSIGFLEAPLHSYIGEVGEPHFRGTMSTMGTAAALLGVLTIHMLGYLVRWRTAALISAAVPLITIVCLTRIPESPTWLIMNGRMKDAQKALGWIRGWLKPEAVQKEFQQLLNHIEAAPKIHRTRSIDNETYQMVPTADCETESSLRPPEESKSYLRSKYEELTDKRLYRPLRMVFIVFFFTSATELSGMRPFMVGIFKDFGFAIDSQLLLVFSIAFFFAGAMLNVVLLRRLGKRRLTLMCQAVATLCILLLGTYTTLFNKSNRIPSLVWIPVTLMSCINFCGGFAITLIPWQLCAEVFPLKGRGTAQGLAAAWAYYVRFVMSKSHLYLERWIKLNGVFFLYGAVAIIAFLYHLRYLPETEDKSLEKIESYFTEDHDEAEKFLKPKSSNKSR
ncbi:unnamed protein product [Bemisia tabaci]|uniref:Major facilitator superfamily (MFS) profile domain-containing protein n=1 Tax=Bemisia tabaci TaxID=7038 RepID=A0A9N9ZZT8_BEMTA|nr:unnamed protein product [Bemisia tabaci]